MKGNADAMRKREIARIKILAKELGLDDAAYRNVLWEITKSESAADLDAAGRKAMIDHLVARVRHTKPGSPQLRTRQRPANRKAELAAKIRALLINAEPARDDAYADAMAQRMFGVQLFTWCSEAELLKLIAALSIDAKRRKGRGAEATVVIFDEMPHYK